MPIGSLISGLFGTFSNQQSIDEQKKENQKAREYNLSLARLQNQWNIDQWNRENVYNSPAAQMQRFAAAGLNPDLIYGQQTTGGQISGSLTSGAPANPANIGALLASKDSNLSKAYGALGDAMMELPMYREELRSKRLDNDEKEIQLGEQQYQQQIRRFVRGLNYSVESLNSLLEFGAGNDDWQNGRDVDPLYNNPDVRRYLMEYARYHRGFKIEKDTEEAIVDKVLADAQLSESEAKKAREVLSSTIDSINKSNVNNIDFSEIERDLNIGKGALSLLKLIVEILK